MPPKRVTDHSDRLGQMRRAGRVQNHATGPGQRDRGRQQFALQPGQRRHVGGLTPPARVGAPPQRAETGARCVDQHPVESRVEAAAAPVDPQHVDRRPRVFWTTRSARWSAGSTAVTRAPDPAASAASSAVLPPGPAHRSNHRPASSATGARVSARATNWLPSSWTSAWPSRTAEIFAGPRRSGTRRTANIGPRCRRRPRPDLRRSGRRAGPQGAPGGVHRRRRAPRRVRRRRRPARRRMTVRPNAGGHAGTRRCPPGRPSGREPTRRATIARRGC